jgi:hypothetical protein
MGIGRTILALMIAISVAMLPVAGAFASATQSAVGAMSGQCGHDHGSHDGKAVGGALSAAVCAANCFIFVTPVVSAPVPPIAGAKIELSLVPRPLLLHGGSRLFRPPRA